MHAPLADQIKGCKFSGGKPESGALATDPSTTYIIFVAKSDDPKIDHKGRAWKGVDAVSTTDGGEVSGCEFLRSSDFEGGGIAVESYADRRPKGTLMEHNAFGGSDPSSDGYFVHAINDGGENTMIRYNTIRRKPSVDAAQIYSPQDFGILSEGADGSQDVGNVIAGWKCPPPPPPPSQPPSPSPSPPIQAMQQRQCVATADGKIRTVSIPEGKTLDDPRLQKRFERMFNSPIVLPDSPFGSTDEGQECVACTGGC